MLSEMASEMSGYFILFNPFQYQGIVPVLDAPTPVWTYQVDFNANVLMA